MRYLVEEIKNVYVDAVDNFAKTLDYRVRDVVWKSETEKVMSKPQAFECVLRPALALGEEFRGTDITFCLYLSN